jgi:hypothetical protein
MNLEMTQMNLEMAQKSLEMASPSLETTPISLEIAQMSLGIAQISLGMARMSLDGLCLFSLSVGSRVNISICSLSLSLSLSLSPALSLSLDDHTLISDQLASVLSIPEHTDINMDARAFASRGSLHSLLLAGLNIDFRVSFRR